MRFTFKLQSYSTALVKMERHLPIYQKQGFFQAVFFIYHSGIQRTKGNPMYNTEMNSDESFSALAML
jgi:hypothetical protein